MILRSNLAALSLDANDDGEPNLADVVAVVGVAFRGRSFPAPDMICGLDGTDDDSLDGASFPVCD